MNMWRLMKLHKAGASLAMPDWLELGYATTYGQVPGLTAHMAAQYGLDDHHRRGGGRRGEELHILKVNKMFGAERMVELKGQEDVWNQLKEPGASDARSQLGGMSVKYAMGQIKRED
jgi:hypothetical protein